MFTKIIAEVGANHMGNMDLACRMINEAHAAGVDIVKVQSWQADKLCHHYPDYSKMYEYYKACELSDSDHVTLMRHCNDKGIELLTTCFDRERIGFLASLNLKRIKVASPDCGSRTMIGELLDVFDEVIISTGMSTDEDVVSLTEFFPKHRIVIMHCVSLYPTPFADINLERMEWIRSLGVEVGFSDHSLGTEASCIAMAMGAKYVEKHFTTDRELPGKDQKISSLPQDFREICRTRDLVSKIRGQSHPELSDQVRNIRAQYIGKWGNNV